MEILKINEIAYATEVLVKSRNLASRELEKLRNYFVEFERTDYQGRYITNEYKKFQKDIVIIDEYYNMITNHINERRDKKNRL